MRVLLRLLGVELLSRVAQRLPGDLAWWAGLVVLVVVNLLPIAAVLAGEIGVGDVFLVYWIENVVVWATGIVRTATAEGGGPQVKVTGWANTSAGFFALHYGIFTLVHGVFTFVIVALTGLEGGLGQVLLLSAAIAVGHLVQLGVVWFGRDERKLVSPGTAMFAAYPRMFVMQAAVISAFWFLDGGPSGDGRLGEDAGAAILCGLKTLIDVGFHLRRRPRPVVDDGELYGAGTG
jgi:hypothetical protein